MRYSQVGFARKVVETCELVDRIGMEPNHELEWFCGPKSLESANGFASMNALWVGTCQGDSEPGQLSSSDIG